MSIVKLKTINYLQGKDFEPSQSDYVRLTSNGVSNIDLKKTNLDHEKEIETLRKLYHDHEFHYDEDFDSFEIMLATYVLPHNDDDFLEFKEEWEDKNTKEYQLLIPIKMNLDDGYDIYVYETKTKKLSKETCELNKPIIFDFTQIHFSLPSKLTPSEKEILSIIKEDLLQLNESDNNNINVFRAFEKKVLNFKKTNTDVRWNDYADIQFLAGRICGPENIQTIKNQDKLDVTTSNSKLASKPKFKPF
jgi:hypothetical protein